MSGTYTTIQGDMWDGIAYKALGDVKHTDKLMAANPAWLEQCFFSAGVELTLPDVDETATQDELPPWKRVSG